MHKELIYCPDCDSIQEATVQHTVPFWTYFHICTNCQYVIMESEWNRVGEQKGLKVIKNPVKKSICILAMKCWRWLQKIYRR